MMWDGYGMGAAGWLFMMASLMGLVVVVLFVVALAGRGDRRERQDPALERLRMRLASGEIGEEEFERSRKLLMGQ